MGPISKQRPDSKVGVMAVAYSRRLGYPFSSARSCARQSRDKSRQSSNDGTPSQSIKAIMLPGSKPSIAGVLLLWFSCVAAVGGQMAQSSDSSEKQPGSEASPLTVRSNLVLVPVLVKTKAGEPVFSLTADDFLLTDNGVPQSLRLEPDTDLQPLALAVILETGGQGAFHLGDYHHLGAVR